MIKKLVLAAVVVALFPVSNSFAQNYGNGPGCGLGAMIFQGNKKIVHQVLAATTNGILGNQTFGISSGTLGCTNDGIVKNEEKVNVFASTNLDSLSQEMAQGKGEHLASLASLIGVPADHQAAFFTLTQEKYTEIFKSEQTTSTEMLASLNSEMLARPELASYTISH
ncbi:MAG TPA: DUF3015 domain-containing protein [Candidatus Manganitrophaceae bacterium]|nr:DUF3015 domain-containing protein [Candidatus Manganitrophaceae bacterium]